jgi:hypothetical protein
MTLIEAANHAHALFPGRTVHVQKQVTIYGATGTSTPQENYVMSIIPGIASECDAVSGPSLSLCIEALQERINPPSQNLE